ncbi:putative uncharacterized protein FRMD6-AS1 [Cervus elaphus]|uniref:putative uncharacterized protein FRMD6-AS1 n=1 Tax=Cervus canadensis TaxID=1574408 RepID=UPI001C9E94D8|nr:putative uncharacterized protein FRMD6-AS1 [Cervus canadensis]XP_043327606.1 putative uncharacterized protein FRMD6-AS1 [Cervus canadensis]XP_043774943.1 putative uncharacterized protein FRMD6-AS1 [Cervus elaphus]XP_043774944.1 putative uncharacterized protein FRMD6-AS1 [Cervus elaphus]
MAPSDTGLRSRVSLPPELSPAGWGRQFGLSFVLAIRNDGGEATGRGGGPSGGGLAITSSSPPVPHPPAHPPLRTPVFRRFYAQWRRPRRGRQAFPANCLSRSSGFMHKNLADKE